MVLKPKYVNGEKTCIFYYIHLIMFQLIIAFIAGIADDLQNITS